MRRMNLPGLAVAIIALAGAGVHAAADATSEQIKAAVNRSSSLILKSLAEYPRHHTCFSCHHHGVPTFMLSLLRERGYPVAASDIAAVVQHTQEDLRSDIALYQKLEGQPGAVTRAGYALFALASAGTKRDEITDAVTNYILKHDDNKGFWPAASNRPPTEASSFTNTFLAIRALKAFGAPADSKAAADRIAHARQWVEETQPKDTEDRVFRIWAMEETSVRREAIRMDAKALLETQRADGGWSQLPRAASDAYATGTALTVMLLTHSLSPRDAACRRAVKYLLGAQETDGSWHVVTRSHPVMPYFESGFPHGMDQFISIAASAWATTALALAGPQSVAAGVR